MGTPFVFLGARSFFQFSADELAEIARAGGYRQRELATQLRLTSRTLERYFHVRFGCTPSEWIANLRMQHAVEFLARGGSIKQAAGVVAFRHETSFFREFRRRFRCTPLEYVRRNTFGRVGIGGLVCERSLSQSASILSQSACPRRLPLGAAV